MNSRTVLTIPVSSELNVQIAKAASKAGISIDEFVRYYLSETIQRLEMQALIQEIKEGRTSKQIRADFRAMMDEARQRPALPDEEIPKWDRMPEWE